jgi:hypothetical protein
VSPPAAVASRRRPTASTCPVSSSSHSRLDRASFRGVLHHAHGAMPPLLATRVLCGIISARMQTSTRPAWTTTAGDVRISGDFLDWYGGKVGLPEPAGGLLAISFDPLLWGQDGVSTPLLLSFLTRGLPGRTIDLLYPAYFHMIELARPRWRRSTRRHGQDRSTSAQPVTQSDLNKSLNAPRTIARERVSWLVPPAKEAGILTHS